MWIWCAIASALMLGIYDVFKKQALARNSVLMILLATTSLSAIFLSPFLFTMPFESEWQLILKSAIVTISWVSGLAGMKYLPLTTAGTLKAFRPVIVVLISVSLLGERLNVWQFSGVLLAFVALFMLSSASSREGIRFTHSRGFFYMCISIVSGVCSALLDKFIMRDMHPLYVQSHCNLYIALMMGFVLFASCYWERRQGGEPTPFVWDWKLLMIALFITGADFLYFYALSLEGALLSVISITRRLSVVVTFVFGAILFHERNVKRKALALLVLLLATTLLVIGS